MVGSRVSGARTTGWHTIRQFSAADSGAGVPPAIAGPRSTTTRPSRRPEGASSGSGAGSR